MNNRAQLTSHEVLELHEIIRSEVLGVKKIQASLLMVADPDLTSFMQRSMQFKKDTLTSYQAFYHKSEKQQ